MSEQQTGPEQTPGTNPHPARPLVAVGAVLAGTVLVAGVGAVTSTRSTPDRVAARNVPSPVASRAPDVDAGVVSAAVAAAGGGVLDSAVAGPAGGWLVTVRQPAAVAYVLTDATRTVRSVRVQPTIS